MVLALGACRSGATTPPPADPPPTTTADTAGDDSTTTSAPVGPDDECVSLVELDVVVDAFVRGRDQLEQSRDGEHHLAEPFEQAMGALKFAADNGHRAAQSLYGRTQFSAMFMAQAPTPEEREQYVAVLSALRVAALRGDLDAQQFLPGLTADQLTNTEPPLSDLPAEWLQEANDDAQAWMACHRAEADARDAGASEGAG